MSSELAAYNLIKSAMQQADELGFQLDYRSDRWRLEGNGVHGWGATAQELHQYLNGYRDGRRTAQQEGDG